MTCDIVPNVIVKPTEFSFYTNIESFSGIPTATVIKAATIRQVRATFTKFLRPKAGAITTRTAAAVGLHVARSEGQRAARTPVTRTHSLKTRTAAMFPLQKKITTLRDLMNTRVRLMTTRAFVNMMK
jgi:hypothetical protein